MSKKIEKPKKNLVEFHLKMATQQGHRRTDRPWLVSSMEVIAL